MAQNGLVASDADDAMHFAIYMVCLWFSGQRQVAPATAIIYNALRPENNRKQHFWRQFSKFSFFWRNDVSPKAAPIWKIQESWGSCRHTFFRAPCCRNCVIVSWAWSCRTLHDKALDVWNDFADKLTIRWLVSTRSVTRTILNNFIHSASFIELSYWNWDMLRIS